MPKQTENNAPAPLSTPKMLEDLVDQLVEQYGEDQRTSHIDSPFLPSRLRCIEIVELIRRILFPGFFDERRVTSTNVRFHIGELLSHLHELLHDQIFQALCYSKRLPPEQAEGEKGQACSHHAWEVTGKFMTQMPSLRGRLATDVQAAFDGDPAAQSTDETIFCYPGLDAIFIYRVAHILWNLDVPLIARIMGEYAHNETGIDIHPGAQIGESFFIDHGTGVVIGETTIIGDRVKIYQGVTLGALSTKGGQAWRGRKRHPTLEDDVTIYPNATILGGDTTIGARCVINGSVFLTHSVPADHTVRVDHPSPQLKARRSGKPTG